MGLSTLKKSENSQGKNVRNFIKVHGMCTTGKMDNFRLNKFKLKNALWHAFLVLLRRNLRVCGFKAPISHKRGCHKVFTHVRNGA